MAAPRTVVVTRPGEAGRALADALHRRGQPALWLPAFDFAPAPDEAAARTALAGLAAFDLAIFVSPQAARATASLLSQPWPARTVIAAVGNGTRAAVRAAIAGAASATLIAPDGDDEARGGSEALWPKLRALPQAPRRVLLLRAQAGREWLAEQLQSAGATVTPLAVYARTAFAPSPQLLAQLDDAAPSGLAAVISSSDAVDALSRMLSARAGVLQALRDGPALAVHPRVVERLRAAGFRRAAVCAPTADAVLEALRAGLPLESAAPSTVSSSRRREEHRGR